MESAPVTLYLDIQKGHSADLEVVARAAIAFARTIRETAISIDPLSDVRIELESGEKGSLKLKAVIKNIEQWIDLKTIAGALVLWFITSSGDWTLSKIYDHLLEDKEVSERLSEDQIQELAARIEKAISNKNAKRMVKRVYEELNQDDVIVGVGVSPNHTTNPKYIVPKSDFHIMIESPIEDESSKMKRVRVFPEKVGLISPVLENQPRKWKFSSKEGTLSASVQDKEFLEKIYSGESAIPMTSGIQMDVLLEVIEELIDGVWTRKSAAIIEVRRVSVPMKQQVLFRDQD